MNICLPSIFIFTRLPRLIQQWMRASTVSLVDDYDGRYRNWNWHLIRRLFMNQVVVMGLYSTNLASGNSTLQWSQSDQRKLRARIVSVPGMRTLFVELKTMMSLWPLPSLTIPYPHYQDIESEALGFDSVSQGNCAPRYKIWGRVINLPTARGFWRLPIHLEGVPQVTATATRAVGQLQAATCLEGIWGNI